MAASGSRPTQDIQSTGPGQGGNELAQPPRPWASFLAHSLDSNVPGDSQTRGDQEIGRSSQQHLLSTHYAAPTVRQALFWTMGDAAGNRMFKVPALMAHICVGHGAR